VAATERGVSGKSEVSASIAFSESQAWRERAGQDHADGKELDLSLKVEINKADRAEGTSMTRFARYFIYGGLVVHAAQRVGVWILTGGWIPG